MEQREAEVELLLPVLRTNVTHKARHISAAGTTMQLPCVAAVTAARTPMLPGSEASQVCGLWQTE